MGYTHFDHDTKRWSVIISIYEHEKNTEAKAFLFRPGRDLTGVGLAPLEPADHTAPKIGDELAAARALSDLATQLFAVTASDIQADEQTATARQ